ncbi:MAG TPA: type II toxin-antitoxin system RelE/ParE family toxin [Bryobacteraceae bacterium]|nr:type II toxin-antitoxin system RelE/ParE family toxin [Bryobacteraceae bacterium]
MPRIDDVFYQEDRTDVPVLDWLKKLRRSDQGAYESCVAAIARLAECGHELRRPLVDILRDGIYELRIRKGRVNYRILYFFHRRNLAILGHALTKEDVVPKADVERAIRRKKAFVLDPARHTYEEEEK